MKTRAIALAALATLALSACSSGSPSDSTAGDASTAASPTITVAETTTSADNGGAAGSDFCASVANLTGVDADVLAQMNAMSALMSDSTKWEDPATIAGLHETGQAMLDELPAVTGYYETMAGQANDPEVQKAIRSMEDLYSKYFAAMAQSALTAPDIMTFATGFLDLTASEDMTAVMSDATDAANVVATYASANCS